MSCDECKTWKNAARVNANAAGNSHADYVSTYQFLTQCHDELRKLQGLPPEVWKSPRDPEPVIDVPVVRRKVSQETKEQFEASIREFYEERLKLKESSACPRCITDEYGHEVWCSYPTEKFIQDLKDQIESLKAAVVKLGGSDEGIV